MVSGNQCFAGLLSFSPRSRAYPLHMFIWIYLKIFSAFWITVVLWLTFIVLSDCLIQVGQNPQCLGLTDFSRMRTGALAFSAQNAWTDLAYQCPLAARASLMTHPCEEARLHAWICVNTYCIILRKFCGHNDRIPDCTRLVLVTTQCFNQGVDLNGRSKGVLVYDKAIRQHTD